MSQSVARALSLLDRVASGTSTLGELAAAEGVHKSTVLRLLRVLEDEGFVHHDGEHRYRLGPHLFRLAHQALDSFEVRVVAANRLKALRDETAQTVHLAVLDGTTAVYVDKLEPREMPVRMASRIGKTAALHSTAVGKVLLSGLDAAERDELVEALPYVRYTGNTPAGPAELRAEIARTAERGWSEDHAENETFINCVGAPIRGADGRILAAVSISVPDVLLPYEDVLALAPALMNAVADISRDCGYR
ncbi:IclR family transcriptional regulator [Cryptosporangium arvum]|uniref:IclR family transcriptional regulator n=1 Tax=Cryptosporangium arvum TaxID=80871 RepID=UPI0004B65A82|nr:IclR family transcriptional regulator [Cryptosporangium arvum]